MAAENYIRQWRTLRRMTLEDMQDRTGIDHGLLSKLESGKRRLNSDHIGALASALGIEPYMILISPHDETLALAARLRRLSSTQRRQAAAIIDILLNG